MQHAHHTHSTSARFAYLRDELPAGCDPEFDAGYDDLEREFAELRLHLADE